MYQMYVLTGGIYWLITILKPKKLFVNIMEEDLIFVVNSNNAQEFNGVNNFPKVMII